MKIEVYLTIGYPGADRSEIIDTVEDWHMDENATEDEINDAVKDWASNFIEYGYKPVDGEEQQ
jgi:hypothetical protein